MGDVQSSESAATSREDTEVSAENLLGNHLFSFDGQNVGRVDFVFTGSGGEAAGSRVAAVASHFRGRKVRLWKLVPIRGARLRHDGAIVVPFGRELIQSAPELASAPTDLGAEMASRVQNHYSGVHPGIELKGPFSRKPLPASGLERFAPSIEEEPESGATGDSLILSPIPGDEAFSHSSESAHWAQAAQLIGVGVQLSGHHDVLDDWEDDARTLLIPRVESLRRGDPWPQAKVALEKMGLLDAFYSVQKAPPRCEREFATLQSRLWEESYLNQCGVSSEAATALLYSGLFSPNELVRTSSASQLSWLVEDIEGEIRNHLVQGCQSDSYTVQMISAGALARHEEDHEVLQNFINSQPSGPTEDAHTSTIVHGTWAANGVWWRPEGDFFQFLKQRVSPDLYDGEGYFRWSAKWKKKERRKAGFKLVDWLNANVNPLPGTRIREFDTVFGHSHGANVALAAGLIGAKITFLVLLHPAIDRRSPREMQLILSNISGVLAFFPHFDLTVLADRSLRGFPRHDEKVVERNIPGWFKHDALLDPYTWLQNGLINELNYYRNQARARRRDLQF
ncbi:hypothetical protein ABT173_35990 [Streptomyces sp. NPDC001795]|uniref:hypothetical protein n=1 Tax=Streptomyces sp. NPDC001795 TaxID=3154525 RepID=UPI003318BB51